MTCRFFPLAALLAAGSASAQVVSSNVPAHTLDLSVPKQPIQYRSDPNYTNDPPGTFYGDTSNRNRAPAAAPAGSAIARSEHCQGKLHGAVESGIGYSNHGGSSNWQAANLSSCKTYYDDEGKAHQIGVSIRVGRGEGPALYGRHAPWSYGPGPFGW